MDKLLFGIIAVLWTLLIGASAMASIAASEPGETLDTGTELLAVDAEAAVLSVSSTSSLVTPVRAAALDLTRPPTVTLGQTGGAEWYGSLVVCALLLRSARRRRII